MSLYVSKFLRLHVVNGDCGLRHDELVTPIPLRLEVSLAVTTIYHKRHVPEIESESDSIGEKSWQLRRLAFGQSLHSDAKLRCLSASLQSQLHQIMLMCHLTPS